MKLMAPEPFCEKYFSPGSQPPRATLHRWLRTGKIRGATKVGGKWYVDEDLWLADNDPLVEMVLKAG